MKHLVRHALRAAPLLSCALLGPAVQALELAQVPLFLSPAINPNVLVMLDNSQSMDAAMGGKMLSGDNPATRSNVARSVLRDVIGSYRYSFNWGLSSFAVSGSPAPYNTFGYYLGTDVTMQYTSACVDIVDGVGKSGGLRCLANPEPANGYAYLTFDRSGDDPDVNDVTYAPDGFAQMYGVGTSDPATYSVFAARSTDPRLSGIGWASRDFENFRGRQTFAATDSGWLADSVALPRRLWVARGWGYDNAITGGGAVIEAVVDSQGSTSIELAAEAAHHARLNALLAPEDATPGSANLKNAARYTPLAGTVETGRRYFEGNEPGLTSPIAATCQANFAILATDGNPTGRKNGSQYDPLDWVNTYDSVGMRWTYGPAILDVLTEIGALRTTARGSDRYDVQTYVIGMGDGVLNASSIATLNEMAKQGGTNQAFLASSERALKDAFQAVAGKIQEQKHAAGGSVAVSSSTWLPGTALYQGRFSSVDWSGELVALPVNKDGVLSPAPTWQASVQLGPLHWDTGRSIVTYKPSALLGARGIPLRWPADLTVTSAVDLDPAQRLALNTDAFGTVDTFGELRLRYLRGDSSREARLCAECAPKFRDRPRTVLGDIVGSAPLHVGAPAALYYDDFETVSYASFAATWRERSPYLYVGANDGMLHAFDAATGTEKFAYVPNLVFGSLSALTAIPFTHRYNVDGSPVVSDVFYAGAWHSLLVSGLRAGGRGLFALDVTDPANFSEGGAASIARWEFSHSDMGHVFTSPMLVKTNNGRWSVITGNGYENTIDGRSAVLFVIDAETGAVVSRIAAAAGVANGLSGPAAIDVDGDAVVDVVYAGDLNGKLWKFDLSAASPDAWALAAGGAALFDAGAGKAITSRPDVTRTSRGGYMVSFGTGRYLSTNDPSSVETQTVYGIWDRDNSVVDAADLQQQIIETVTASSGGDTYRLSTHRVGAPSDTKIEHDEPMITQDTYYASKRGWFIDLPTAGERVVADARIRGGRVIFTSIIPDNSDVCRYGGSGWILEFDIFTGNRLDSATFDVDNNGVLDSRDYLEFGGAGSGGNNVSGWRIGAVPAAPAFMGVRNDTANTEFKFVNTSDGTLMKKREAAGTGGQGRLMWRLLQ